MRTKKLLLALVCILPLAGYSQKTVKTYYDYQHQHVKEAYTTDNYGVKTGTYTLYSQYGGILTQGAYKNDKQVGKWTVKDEKGVLLSEANYDNDGLPNGHSIDYKDGHKEFEGDYLHGKKNRHWKTWYTTDDGASAYTQLHYDEYYKSGLYDSVWTEYFINGKIKKQCHYINGNLSGESKTYNEQGILLTHDSGSYINGVQNGDWVDYDAATGEVMNKGKYKNGQKWGPWKITFDAQWKVTSDKSKAAFYRLINYSDDGIWKGTDYYITGEKQGVEIYTQGNYYSNGYGGDIETGTFISYYKNGQVNEKGRFNNKGKQDSVYTVYYEDGKVKSRTTFNNGRQGETINYDANGKATVQPAPSTSDY
ncbi:MAG: toxin-antitoxin system YwqK family antitoxin [Bacteroidia bacterium]